MPRSLSWTPKKKPTQPPARRASLPTLRKPPTRPATTPSTGPEAPDVDANATPTTTTPPPARTPTTTRAPAQTTAPAALHPRSRERLVADVTDMGSTTGPLLQAAVDAYNLALRDGETADPKALLDTLRGQQRALQREERRLSPGLTAIAARLVPQAKKHEDKRARKAQAVAFTRSAIDSMIADLEQVAAIDLRQLYRVRFPDANEHPQLAFNRPIRDGDIAEITMLKEAAVYDVAGRDGTHVIVKIENRTEPRHVARERINYMVSRWLLQGAPASEPLTDDERTLLAGLPDPPLTPSQIARVAANRQVMRPGASRLDGITSLVPSAAAPERRMAFRVQRMAIGKNFHELAEQRALPRGFPTPETLEDFGRLAVFDRLMNNEDRFSVDNGAPYIQFENIDFDPTGTRILAIDNFDPNGGIEVNPAAYHAIRTADARMNYARGALEAIYTKARMTPTPAERARNLDHFIDGMNAAVGTIRAQRGTLDAARPVSDSLTGDAAASATTQIGQLIHILNDIQ